MGCLPYNNKITAVIVRTSIANIRNYVFSVVQANFKTGLSNSLFNFLILQCSVCVCVLVVSVFFLLSPTFTLPLNGRELFV